MSEQVIIPAEMLDAAAKAVVRYEANLHSCSLRLTEEFYGEMIEVALRAAGVPELASAREAIGAALFRHGYDTGWTTQEAIECIDAMAARIAELEAALSLAIPRMEHLQSLLSCGESVQFCNEFDEQKGKDVAEEVERLTRTMQNAPTGTGGE